MFRPPYWLVLLALPCNAAVTGVLWERGERVWLLFLAFTLINLTSVFSTIRTAVRTAESDTAS